MYTALNNLRAIDEGVFKETLEDDVPPIREYPDWPEVDWSDWSSHITPLAADDKLVLFSDFDGRLFSMTWDDILDTEEA